MAANFGETMKTAFLLSVFRENGMVNTDFCRDGIRSNHADFCWDKVRSVNSFKSGTEWNIVLFNWVSLVKSSKFHHTWWLSLSLHDPVSLSLSPIRKKYVFSFIENWLALKHSQLRDNENILRILERERDAAFVFQAFGAMFTDC